MLFGVTDTSVLIAVIVYAVIPPTRYTVEGLRNVPESLLEAGDMSGATKLQRLVKIEFPLAFPHIMLGVNQCVVFALFMVIIGAFIGTDRFRPRNNATTFFWRQYWKWSNAWFMRGVYRSCSGSFNPDLGNEEKKVTGY